MGCTGATGSTILLKRSCTAGATPDMACLTVGELALNLNDGKIFARGCTTGQFFTWSKDGSTADDIVTSVQGMTGDVTFADLVGVCSVNGATGAVSFNYVPSVAGSSGALLLGSGLTQNGQTLGIDNTAYLHVAGISLAGGITFDGNLMPPSSGFTMSNVNISLGAVGAWGGKTFFSNSSGITIAAINGRGRIHLSGDQLKVTLTADTHRDIFNLVVGSDINSAGITIGLNVGISGGICAAGGDFTGITCRNQILVGHINNVKISPYGITANQIDLNGGIDVRGGKIKIGSVGLGNHTTYSFPSTMTQSLPNGEYGTYSLGPKILYQPSQSTGLGNDHPLAFVDLGKYCVLNLDGATGSIKCGTGLTVGGPGGGNTLGIDPTSVLTVAGVSLSGGITFSDGTNQTTAPIAPIKQRTTATFNINSSSGITGAKTQGLYYVPWAATIKFVGVKGSTGDFVATLRRAGATSFFSDASSSSVLQTSVGVTYGVFGATANSVSSGGSFTMPASSYLYLDVVQNNGGSTAMNFFVDLERD